jgi:hypothetical protein
MMAPRARTEHPVRDRDEDRQQQAEAAELDGEEHEARVMHVQIRGVRGQADETGAEATAHESACQVLPGRAR